MQLKVFFLNRFMQYGKSLNADNVSWRPMLLLGLSSRSSVLCTYKCLKTKFEELGNFKFVDFPDLIA